MANTDVLTECLRAIDEAAGKTYVQARDEILKYLGANRWKLSNLKLKIPHATSPYGNLRLWFRKQAIYYSVGGGRTPHSLGDASSLHVDIRNLTPEQFVADVARYSGERI